MAVRWKISFHSAAFFMHLLYLDDAGSDKNSSEEYIVLGGISVFESTAYHLAHELEVLAESIDPENPAEVEFHASEIFSRRISPWNKLSREEAQGVIKAVLKILANASASTYAFACAIHKSSYPGHNHLSFAFEDLTKRFDIFLKRLNFDGDRQRELLILDESAHETTLQNLARNFRKIGTQWGSIKHLADIPFFVNSKASRLIQLADHVAYSVFRRYNAFDTQYFDIIAHRFYSADNVIHGLAHKQKVNFNCMCLACMSRRAIQSVEEDA
jgi:hypothetical protein